MLSCQLQCLLSGFFSDKDTHPGWEASNHHHLSSSVAVNITNRPELLRRVLSTYSCSGYLGVAEDVARAIKGAVLWEEVWGALLQRHSALGGRCSQGGKETQGLYVLGVSGMVTDRLTWGGKK